jgi:hypothetical protein
MKPEEGIYEDRLASKQEDAEAEGQETAPKESIEQRVANFTKALAPFLLPMIDALGALDAEKVATSSASGEAT